MTNENAVCHALVRTNEFGVPFIGRCIQCGADGLSSKAALVLCPNPNGATAASSLMAVINNKTTS